MLVESLERGMYARKRTGTTPPRKKHTWDTKAAIQDALSVTGAFISRSFRPTAGRGLCRLLARDHGRWRRLLSWCPAMNLSAGDATKVVVARRCSRSSLSQKRFNPRCYMPPPTITVDIGAGRAAADRRRHRRTFRHTLGTQLKAEQLRILFGRFWC